MLLPSGPDTVREPPLRGTRPSTSPGAAAFESEDLGREFSPAGADCRYRAPLVPRLARPGNHTSRQPASRRRWGVAEREGFEPSVLSHTAFRERHHQPLGHLSARENTRAARLASGPLRPGLATLLPLPTTEASSKRSASLRRPTEGWPAQRGRPGFGIGPDRLPSTAGATRRRRFVLDALPGALPRGIRQSAGRQ